MLVRLPAAVPPSGNATHFKVACPICRGKRCVEITWKPERRDYVLRCWQCPDGLTGPWLGQFAREVGSDTYTLKLDPFGAAGLVIAESSSGGPWTTTRTRGSS